MKKTKADAGGRKAKVRKHTQARDTRDARDTRRDAKPAQTMGEDEWKRICPDKPWREMDAAQLLKNAWRVVSALEKLAYAGDSEAAIALVNISFRCADTPERLLPESPALQAKLRKAAYWPAGIPVSAGKRNRLVAELNKHGFGTDSRLVAAARFTGATEGVLQIAIPRRKTRELFRERGRATLE